MNDPGLPVNYCANCGQVHPPMIPCQEAQAAAMLKLLRLVGKQDTCRGCLKTIYWVRHLESGKTAPYTEAGLNHFIDCPQRDEFKRRSS